MKTTEYTRNGVQVKIIREAGSMGGVSSEEVDYYLEDMQKAFPGRKIGEIAITLEPNDRVSIDVELVPLTHREMRRPTRFRRSDAEKAL